MDIRVIFIRPEYAYNFLEDVCYLYNLSFICKILMQIRFFMHSWLVKVGFVLSPALPRLVSNSVLYSSSQTARKCQKCKKIKKCVSPKNPKSQKSRKMPKVPRKTKKKNAKNANSSKISKFVKVVEIAKIAMIPEVAETKILRFLGTFKLWVFIGKLDGLFEKNYEFHSKSLKVTNLR